MNIFNLRSKRDTDLEPDVEHETWLKQVYVMGNIEKRAKHAAVALDDNQVFIFGGQTDKKEIDNSCFIIQERIIDEPNAPREPIISKIKVTLKKSDLKRKQTLVQMEKDTVRYYITIPPISNPHESPPSLRSHTAVRYKDKIVIFGGKNKAFLNSTYILNTTTWYNL
jgi:N-acetylneuraminic acid mutarotase